MRPPNVAEQVRKLVERDEVLRKFQVIGAGSTAAIQKDLNLNDSGYITAELLVQVLKQCDDGLIRENVLKQFAHLTNVELDLLLPGIIVTTLPTDYRVNKQLQMVQFERRALAKVRPADQRRGDEVRAFADQRP